MKITVEDEDLRIVIEVTADAQRITGEIDTLSVNLKRTDDSMLVGRIGKQETSVDLDWKTCDGTYAGNIAYCLFLIADNAESIRRVLK